MDRRPVRSRGNVKPAKTSPEKLNSFCRAILQKAGLGKKEAASVAESLVFADLRGVDSHGVVRLESYIDRVRAGVMKLNPAMKIERNELASALLDAQNGFGQIAGVAAMRLAIEKAKTCGIGAVGVKNSNHFGVAAYFAVKALEKNMIGMVLTNASPAIAPYKAKTPLLGTNPLAVAIPAKKQKPIVLDMASSVVARGKIRLTSLAGKKIPLGWALDEKGAPTDDPNLALKGTLEAIGGAKGCGLSLVIDLLCGVLTGTGLTGDVKNITDTKGPCRTGHLFLAFNIARFVPIEKFKKNIDEIVLRIKGLPSVDGGPVCLPGEIEFEIEERRLKEGIPLDDEVLASLEKLAERYGVEKCWN